MHGLRIAVAGAGGRMGQMLIEATLRDAQARLVGAFDCADSPALGRNAGEMVGLPSSVVVDSDAEAAISRASCLIDFTRPEGTLQHLEFCRRHGVAIVIGTTGFDGAGKKAISRAASDIPIVFAPNMSVGVNVVLRLLETAAHILHDGYDVEIVEAHHREKRDDEREEAHNLRHALLHEIAPVRGGERFASRLVLHHRDRHHVKRHRLRIDPSVVLKPSVLVKYVQNAPVEADFNLNVLLANVLWIGGSYRTQDAIVGLVELQVSKKLRIGYSYDFTTTEMKNYSQGSHEIMIGYDFGYDIMKMKTPRYF